MEKDLYTLNCLREDFIKWADSNEPSVYELELNKIGGKLTGFDSVTEPTILLDCNKSKVKDFCCLIII